MANTLHEEDILVSQHAGLKPLKRRYDAPKLQVNQKAFLEAFMQRQWLDVQQAQAKGWLPGDTKLFELPAFQRAKAVDEAGYSPDEPQPMDMDEVMKRREEREEQRRAAQEAARLAAEEEAAKAAAAKAAAAEERLLQKAKEKEDREQRRKQHQEEREKRQEEKVLRQQDRILEKKERKLKRRQEQEKRHATQAAAWDEQVTDIKHQIAEMATQREELGNKTSDLESRLSTLLEDKHALVLQLKQALQAEESARQEAAALASLEEGEMAPPGGGAVNQSGLMGSRPGAASPGPLPGFTPSAATPIALTGRAAASLALGAELRSPVSAGGLSYGGFGGGPSYLQHGAGQSGGLNTPFSPPAGGSGVGTPGGASIFTSPLPRPGSFGEGLSGRSSGAGSGGFFAREEDRAPLGRIPSGGRGFGRGGGGGPGLWSPRGGGGREGGGGLGFASPREHMGGPPPFGGPLMERGTLRCYQCGEPGHFARECPHGRGGGPGPGPGPGPAGPPPPAAWGGPGDHPQFGRGAPEGVPHRGGGRMGGGGGRGLSYEERQRDREMRGLAWEGGREEGRRGDRDGFGRGFGGRGRGR